MCSASLWYCNMKGLLSVLLCKLVMIWKPHQCLLLTLRKSVVLPRFVLTSPVSKWSVSKKIKKLEVISQSKNLCFWSPDQPMFERKRKFLGHLRQLCMRNTLVSHHLQITTLCVKCWEGPQCITVLVTVV